MPPVSTERYLVERRVGPPAKRDAAAAVPSRSAVRPLRQFLNARRDGWVLETRLTRAADMVAAEACGCGLPAERMLVALKHEWRGVSAVCDQGSHHAALELQARLVSLCIRDYYATAGMARPAVVADRPQPR